MQKKHKNFRQIWNERPSSSAMQLQNSALTLRHTNLLQISQNCLWSLKRHCHRRRCSQTLHQSSKMHQKTCWRKTAWSFPTEKELDKIHRLDKETILSMVVVLKVCQPINIERTSKYLLKVWVVFWIKGLDDRKIPWKIVFIYSGFGK